MTEAKKTDTDVESSADPTTASIEAGNAERARLRSEALRLSKALVAAYTDAEVVAADRDRLSVELDRTRKIGDTMFVEGYDQAVAEIRDHFRKAGNSGVAAEIETTWMKDKIS